MDGDDSIPKSTITLLLLFKYQDNCSVAFTINVDWLIVGVLSVDVEISDEESWSIPDLEEIQEDEMEDIVQHSSMLRNCDRKKEYKKLDYS